MTSALWTAGRDGSRVRSSGLLAPQILDRPLALGPGLTTSDLLEISPQQALQMHLSQDRPSFGHGLRPPGALPPRGLPTTSRAEPLTTSGSGETLTAGNALPTRSLDSPARSTALRRAFLAAVHAAARVRDWVAAQLAASTSRPFHIDSIVPPFGSKENIDVDA